MSISAFVLPLGALGCWQSTSARQQLFRGSAHGTAEVTSVAALPSWVTDALPRLRFARSAFAADDAAVEALVRQCPQFWSLPLQKTLLPRHAFLADKELTHGPALLTSERIALRRLLLEPKGDDKFAEAVCAVHGGLERDEVVRTFSAFATSFRKGGIEAARTGNIAMLGALRSHGWSAGCERDRNGASALHYAAGHGHVECCAFLVDEVRR